MNCFECGKLAECRHHVIPKSLGGTKTIPLCLECHGKVHDKDMTKMKRLQTAGIASAKKRGIFKGRKPGTTKIKANQIKALIAKGLKTKEMAKMLDISERTIQRYKYRFV